MKIEKAVHYGTWFYTRPEGSQRSAEIILPLVFDLLKPKSVVDIGCGAGTWLNAAEALGVARRVGFEGEWAASSGHEMRHEMRLQNLEQPIITDEKFDFAMCVEVAEHLSEDRAPSLVRDLCKFSDFVLFGAAIPGQGGVNHINEQWQSYWAEKFAANGYLPYDVVRPRVWEDDEVLYWYRQNLLLYVRDTAADRLKGRAERCTMVDVVHPLQYMKTPNLRASVKNTISAARQRLGL